MRKTRVITLISAAMLLALLLCVTAFASDVVVINTAEELSQIMQDSGKWAGNYKLGADINLAGHTQRPIGDYNTPFSGTFDGDNHTVKGLNIRTSGTVGLFGAASGTIKNVTVEGSVINTFEASSAETKIEGKYPGAGGVVGVLLSGATLENCISRADVEAPGNAGGVCGVVYNFGSETVSISGCENYGTVYSTAGNCGGVFGRIYVSTSASPAASVKKCINHAEQTLNVDNRNRLGGIVGYVRSEAGVVVIEDCVNNGKLSAVNLDSATKTNDFPYVGGIVGRGEAVNEATSAVQILKCSNTAPLFSGKYAAGIVTYLQRGEVCTENASLVSECINTGDVEASRYVGGIIAYTEMKAVSDNESGAFNCANYGKVTGGDCAGGICGRQYGFYVKECYSAGKTVGTTYSGAVVGMAEGAIYCETDACYYLDSVNTLAVGKSGTMCIEISKEALSADNAKNKDTFKHLDFDNIWTMGENGPTLKMLTGESTSGEIGAETPKSPFTAVRTYGGEFKDVSEGQWFYSFVKDAYEYNLANGTATDKFSPDGKFTVAQALTAAANIHKVYYSKEIRAAYPGEVWYAPYVSYCIDNAIIGYGAFDSYDRNITRGEMAVVFASILPEAEYAPIKDGANPDVTEGMACYEAVLKLFKAGIVGGDAGSGNFRPNDEIVRSEACVIFTRIALAEKRAK